MYAALRAVLAQGSLPVWELDSVQGVVPGVRVEPDRVDVLENGATLVARMRVSILMPMVGYVLDTLDTVHLLEVCGLLNDAGYELVNPIEYATPTYDQSTYRARVITVRTPIS